MKKLLSFLLSLCCLFSLPASGVELKFNTQDFPPFNYEVNGRVTGPAADIIRAVCDEASFSCSFKLMVWKDAQQEVREGKAHAMFVIGWNRGRSEWLYFSPQIMETQYGFFVAKGNQLKYNDITDISGYRVGVYGPSNTSRSLEKIQQKIDKNPALQPLKIDMRTDDVLVFQDLNSADRTISAAYSNRDVGFAIIRAENLSNIRYAGAQRKLNYFIGFSKAFVGKQVVNTFNRTFIELYQSGKVADILDTYAMTPAKIEPHIIAYYTKQ